jgi:hypothetical protein
MNFLFWNLRKNPLQDLLAVLVNNYSVDVLILAECKIDTTTLLQTINQNRDRKLGLAPAYLENDRIKILTILPRSSLQHLRDDGNVVVYKVSSPIGEEIILFAVHLSSKMYLSDFDQALKATRLRSLIRAVEIEQNNMKSLVVGDFNMNPFEDGLVSAETFHAVMSKAVALKRTRIVGGEERHFFYNPMWGKFGDSSLGSAGTYYYDKSGSPTNYYWNIFDQVLLRPDLLPYFDETNLEILTNIGNSSLLTDAGLPNSKFASDHLPIFFSLSI